MIGIDTDAWTMVTALRTVNQVIPFYQVVAVSNFAKRAKANGYWSKILRADFFPGNTILSACYPLKYETGQQQQLISAGPTDAFMHRRMGLAGLVSGAGGPMKTGLVPSTRGYNVNSFTVGVGVGYLLQAGGQLCFGCLSAGGNPPYCSVGFNAPNQFNFSIFSGNAQSVGPASRLSGFYVANRKSSGLVNAWKDGVSFLGDTADVATTLPNQELYVAGRNGGGSGDSALDGRMFSCIIATGMSDTDIQTMSTDHAVCMNEMRRVL